MVNAGDEEKVPILNVYFSLNASFRSRTAVRTLPSIGHLRHRRWTRSWHR